MTPSVTSEDLEALTDALVESSKILVGIAVRTLPESADITLPQFRALVLLDRGAPLRPADLAEELGVSRSSATRLCDRLVKRSLVVREPAEQDRRETYLSITREARTLVRDAIKRRRRELAALVAKIPAPQQAALLDGLQLLQSVAKDAPETAWSEGWPSSDGVREASP
jgi:DNA-binding MarR family transcriptional regulator